MKPRPIVPPPLLFRPLDPGDALKVNQTIPFSDAPNTTARPFVLKGDAVVFDRAVECLATAIYYEAAAEPFEGQRAVAQIVLNRVRHPAFVPSVCAVVYQGSTRATGCQFSFTCDGSMLRRPSVRGWATARTIAARALTGTVFARVGNGTHYHADYVVPYWATSLAKNAVVGRHIFYRWPGWWGTAAAFSKKHSGEEADPRILRAIALRRPAVIDRPIEEGSNGLAAKADPRIELARVVITLAAKSTGEPPTGFEADVRRHFSAFSEHVAVQIYRQLSAGDSRFDAAKLAATLMQHSEPPKLTPMGQLNQQLVEAAGGKEKLSGFLSALRDFAVQSRFDAFLENRQRLAKELETGGRASSDPKAKK